MLSTAGEQLDLGKLMVERESVVGYLDAVADDSPIYLELNVAPPMALAAHVLGALIEKLSLPAGTIHATQELECKGLVTLGQEVSCTATMSRPLQRGGWNFIAARFTVLGQDGGTLLEGKSTVMVPESGTQNG